MQRAWLIEALDKRKHERGAFSCGKQPLDDYLKRTARKAQAGDTGRTWVAIDRDAATDDSGRRPVLGYYTVSMCSVDLTALPEGRRSGLPRPQVPAALLGRLAVDRTAQGEGLGRALLIDALRRMANAAEHVAAHAVVLDAIDEGAKRFYEQYGFLELADDPLHLFLPMDTVRQLLEA